MKSSSQLFPVALMKADVVADRFIEDSYLLKPNNSEDSTVQIAVTRLGDALESNKHGDQPIILVHGSFTNRGFWLSSKGKGLASELLKNNFDPWMIELRGHGDSPVNNKYLDNSILKYAEYDLPAVSEFVQEQTGKTPIWIGHSMGGVVISTALAGKFLDPKHIKALAMFGSQVSKYPIILGVPIIRECLLLLMKLRKKAISSPKGPEVEPLGIAREFVKWAGWFSSWKPVRGKSFWKTLSKTEVPVIAFGAQKDSGDPAKYCEKLASAISSKSEFHLLSKRNGYSKDYGHVDMVIGKEAESEVWPKLIQWLNSIK